jgi:hypothetical protein
MMCNISLKLPWEAFTALTDSRQDASFRLTEIGVSAAVRIVLTGR